MPDAVLTIFCYFTRFVLPGVSFAFFTAASLPVAQADLCVLVCNVWDADICLLSKWVSFFWQKFLLLSPKWSTLHFVWLNLNQFLVLIFSRSFVFLLLLAFGSIEPVIQWRWKLSWFLVAWNLGLVAKSRTQRKIFRLCKSTNLLWLSFHKDMAANL